MENQIESGSKTVLLKVSDNNKNITREQATYFEQT